MFWGNHASALVLVDTAAFAGKSKRLGTRFHEVHDPLVECAGRQPKRLQDRLGCRWWMEETARSLAERLFERANVGEDFESLITDYSDGVYPGTYRLVEAREAGRPRGVWTSELLRVERAVGDVAFGLQVGELGLARYHRTDCRFGWHIIKRLE